MIANTFYQINAALAISCSILHYLLHFTSWHSFLERKSETEYCISSNMLYADWDLFIFVCFWILNLMAVESLCAQLTLAYVLSAF